MPLHIPSSSSGSSVFSRGVTKVVAANDSLDKTNVDYVCDGTDDQVQIQAAIDAVSGAGGGIVQLLDGTFYIHASITPKTYVSIRGVGYSTILQEVVGLTNAMFYYTASTERMDYRDMTMNMLANLPCIKASTGAIGGSYSAYSGLSLNSSLYQIVIGDATHCYFGNLKTETNNASLIFIIGGMSLSQIIGNDNEGGGLVTVDAGCSAYQLQITGNSAYGGSSCPYCIDLQGSGGGHTISGNYLKWGGTAMIRLSDYEKGSSVSGNVLEGSTQSPIGISVINANGTVISNNYITHIKRQAINIGTSINGGIISGNSIFDCGKETNNTYAAIYLVGAEGSIADYWVVIGNRIESTEANKHKYGIQEGSTYADYNFFIGNIITNSGTSNILKVGGNTRVFGNFDDAVLPIISTGTAAPETTPTKVGDIFVDTTGKKMYIATGTSASTDWTITN